MAHSSIPENIVAQATEFFGALAEWERALPALNWHDLAAEVQPEHMAVFSIDMINGFCYEGTLSSPRVKGIIPAVVDAFNQAYQVGVRNFVLSQDCHTADAIEFADFGPHCQVGTSEAQMIPELAALPFANRFTVASKNSLDAFYETSLTNWLEEHKDLRTVVVVGVCTDLCVYLLAMHLKLQANAQDRKLRIIVPANAVQTYDMPIATAKDFGILPHNGDVLHLMFLYHMRLNGIEVVREIIAR
jgi:nicotinamidase-related amidase